MERIAQQDGSFILYEDSRANQPDPAWFDPGHWPDAARTPGKAGGRGPALFIRCAGQDCVLRHYYRGGQAARLTRDRFLWLGPERVRSFAEWRLLRHLHVAGLPVPQPFAARYIRSGLFYTADLITVRLPGVTPLSLRLAAGEASESLLGRVGACVGRFHAAGVDHADLNAHNLQVGADDEIFLLDFDRGQQHATAGAWCADNLSRLRRSLLKISGIGDWRFEPRHWETLVAGYRSTCPDQSPRR